jgi:hypothetical protein
MAFCDQKTSVALTAIAWALPVSESLTAPPRAAQGLPELLAALLLLVAVLLVALLLVALLLVALVLVVLLLPP